MSDPNILHGGYPTSTGVITTSAGVIISGGGGFATITANGASVYGGAFGVGVAEKKIITSPDLPPTVLVGHDENSKKVEMTLKPERSISAYESLQLMMLLISYCDNPESFCPLAFVKKNNLERHFKFA